jgi:hypothetical protein
MTFHAKHKRGCRGVAASAPFRREGSYARSGVSLDHSQRINEIALKLVRAEAQLRAIHEGINRWRESPPYRLESTTGAEGVGRYVWTYRLERSQVVPLEWSLDVGEFLYTLHSSLDHLAWLLAAQRSYPQPPARVTFPIFKNKSRFWRTGSDGRFRRGSGGWALERMPEAAAALVEDVQPFQRRGDAQNHPLWLLHELSNADKHQALHVVASAVVDKQLDIARLEHAEIVSFDVASVMLADSTEVGQLRVRRTTVPGRGPDPRIEVKVRFRVEEVFDVTTPAPAVPVYDVLSQIYAYIRNEVWVARFADYFGVD